MADRYGRRLPLMINVIFYAVISVLCGPRAELRRCSSSCAMLFGIGMGGEWGVGASLALESASPRLRGLLSVCCRKATRSAICWRRWRSGSIYPVVDRARIRATAGA